MTAPRCGRKGDGQSATGANCDGRTHRAIAGSRTALREVGWVSDGGEVQRRGAVIFDGDRLRGAGLTHTTQKAQRGRVGYIVLVHIVVACIGEIDVSGSIRRQTAYLCPEVIHSTLAIGGNTVGHRRRPLV